MDSLYQASSVMGMMAQGGNESFRDTNDEEDDDEMKRKKKTMKIAKQK